MDQPSIQSHAHVDVALTDGRWVVRVTEGAEVYEHEFYIEEHAASFAEGQRMRLGIFVSQTATNR